MKKLVIGALAAVLVVVGLGLLARLVGIRDDRQMGRPSAVVAPVPVFEKLEFEMAYRGLTGGEDEVRYNSYWGFGGGGDETNPFIEAVKAQTKDVTLVYNPRFKGAEWALVEHKGKDVKALYFDLNADGQLTDDERVTSFRRSEGSPDAVECYTPDFLIKTEEGREVKFRAMLQVAFYGGDQPNCMWSPACVLEGHARANGQPVTLLLYTNGFDGEFDSFGRSMYSLQAGAQATGRYLGRHTLSKVVSENGCFYKLRIEHDPNTQCVAKVVVEKDVSPTGRLQVRLLGDANLKVRLNNATLKGAQDEGIHFNVGADVSNLPEGDYRMVSGYIIYGPDDQYRWNTSFKDGPQIAIEPNKTFTMELGRPRMTVLAVDAKDRYSAEPKEKAAYAKGDVIYITPKVVGEAGEVYGRFSNHQNNRSDDAKPVVEICDAAGKRVVSQTLEYG